VKRKSSGAKSQITRSHAKAEDKRVEGQLVETAVGGLHLDFWGVFYFILGTIAGTASPEIAAYLQ
jgi:hypothetical protein